jgi:xanthine dehydrogenase molybdenum-binding subunit
MTITVIDSSGLKIVGKSVPRIDARERVTGRALYPADIQRAGMAHARLKRSPHAHARIVSIDTSRALRLRGVLAIVTAADFPVVLPGTMIPFGETGADAWPIAELNMARDKVLWVGQPVAAVAAVDLHVASEALDLIDVTYEVLEPAVTIEAALRPGAPILHEHLLTKGLEPPARAPSNVGTRTAIERGDTMAAMACAAAVGRAKVVVDTGHQGYIEPQAMVAEVDPNGFATVWTSTQGHHAAEVMLHAITGIPTSRLKVVAMEVGGGFGGKIQPHGEAVTVLLSKKCGRPVKLVFTRDEVLQGGSGPAAGARIEIAAGADKDGKLVALEGTFTMDAGGMPGVPTSLLMQASAAHYQCPNLKLVGTDVVTNKPKTEAYRGPGGIQAAFAMEQAIDDLAVRLKMDPLELRKRNASRTGDPMPIGTPFPSMGLTSILEAVGTHTCWTTPLAKGRLPRGRGLALGYWRGTSMTSACHITIASDGRPMVTLGTVDISGTRTTMAQVAAEEFGLSVEDVHVTTGDTKSVGYSDTTGGSRVARTMAAAVVAASQDALGQLKTRAAEKMQIPVGEVDYAGGVFRARNASGVSITLAQLMNATLTDGAVVGRGVSTKLPFGVEIGAHVADVEVDPETGQVTVLRYTAFQDVGRALNPVAVEGQIQGSVVQGLGWALTEGFDYDDTGRLRNASLLDYRLPTALDVPNIDCVILETPVPGVPYGVRGVGEVPIVPPAAAIGNAIFRAIGVRVPHMPMTPERVVAALKRGPTLRV